MKALEPDQQAEIENLLKSLHELLEYYAPTWYPEELDQRLRAALKMLAAMRTEKNR